MNTTQQGVNGVPPKQTTPFAGNLFFALMMVLSMLYFVWWGYDYTLQQQALLFLVATFLVCLWRLTLAVMMWRTHSARQSVQGR